MEESNAQVKEEGNVEGEEVIKQNEPEKVMATDKNFNKWIKHKPYADDSICGDEMEEEYDICPSFELLSGDSENSIVTEAISEEVEQKEEILPTEELEIVEDFTDRTDVETVEEVNILEHISTESELIVESEVEEEALEEQLPELEKGRQMKHLRKAIEDIISYKFPEDPTQEEEYKLKEYEHMAREFEKQERQIDDMLVCLKKDEKIINILEKMMGPMINIYQKTISSFEKVEGDERFDVDEIVKNDEYRARAAELAREVLEAEEIESLGSMSEESSDGDVKLLSQLAAELVKTEDEDEKRDEGKKAKAVTKNPKAKGAQSKKGKAKKGKRKGKKK